MSNVTTFRSYGTKVVPKLLEKINLVDIVDDVVSGGTGKPLSAEQGKVLNDGLNKEISDRVQEVLNLKGGASLDWNTLKKIEDKVLAAVAALEATDAANKTALETADAAISATVANNKTTTDATIDANRVSINLKVDTGRDEIDAAIAAEATTARAAEKVNADNITKEIADRNAAVLAENTAMLSAVAAERTRAEGKEADNAAAIAAEVVNRSTAVSDQNTAMTTAVTAERTRAMAAEATNAADIAQEITDRTNAISTEVTDRNAAIKVADDRALAAEGVIDTRITTEVATLNQSLADAAGTSADDLAAEVTRAKAAEAVNAAAVVTEQDARVADVAAVNARIGNEEVARANADTLHDNRLAQIESGLVAGLLWQDAVTAVTDLDVVSESESQSGWAYYVSDEKDVYVVIPGANGDYKPADWTTKSFIKFADFAEVTGMVNNEKARAIAEETAIKATVTTNKGIQDTKNGLIDASIATLTQNTTDSDSALDAKLDTEIADRKAAVTAEAATRSADISAEAATRTANDNLIIADLATEVQDRKDAVAAENAAMLAAVKTANDRATAAEGQLTIDLNVEVADRITAVSDQNDTMVATVAAEQARAEAAEQVNADAVVTEANARIAAINTENAAMLAAVAGEKTRAMDAESVNATAVTSEASARAAADTALEGTLRDVITAEETRATAAETANAAAIAQETTDRIADVDAEEARATASETIISGRLDVIEGTGTGSITKNIEETQALAEANAVRPKLEGIGGGLTVNGDTVSVSKNIHDGLNGVVFGEVIVYHNGEAVAVNVATVSNNQITLAVSETGEFNGDKCKVHYFYTNGANTGLGETGMGEGDFGG